MADQALIELSRYRLEKASEMYTAALRDLREQDYASANNRAYYFVFFMPCVLCLLPWMTRIIKSIPR